ncbi:MAG: glycosyltransferase [Patescibacteria group bacterium]
MPQENAIHALAIVIPVYQGERTLPPLIKELAAFSQEKQTSKGHAYRIEEVVLVHDGAIDRSDQVIQELAANYPFVKPVWLSRNFGQHPATLAGIASTVAPWVVTMDEDGQQRPDDIAALLDCALEKDAQLVYGNPINAPPHGVLRNILSYLSKWVFVRLLGNHHIGEFNSFRLLRGEIARGLAAYCGHGVFLDAALAWVVARAEHCPVTVRKESDHRSGYSLRSLVKHFWRLLVTSGTKPLRFISFLGALSLLLCIALTGYALWAKFTSHVPIAGWTSTTIVNSLFFGATLLSLGVVAEYLAIALAIVMGKPPYLITSGPRRKSQS